MLAVRMRRSALRLASAQGPGSAQRQDHQERSTAARPGHEESVCVPTHVPRARRSTERNGAKRSEVVRRRTGASRRCWPCGCAGARGGWRQRKAPDLRSGRPPRAVHRSASGARRERVCPNSCAPGAAQHGTERSAVEWCDADPGPRTDARRGRRRAQPRLCAAADRKEAARRTASAARRRPGEFRFGRVSGRARVRRRSRPSRAPHRCPEHPAGTGATASG
jgi:hypothetical protein